ncbi:site-specific integrase [Rhizobium mesoamericanum]|uniref:site-specific integrase n=1 Tax=Rhizobium mesoamericanum TaxID=1079800 RepID=UPI000427F31E|nr:site-specific integrase [Rhizobium mesoamericanum]
MTGLTYMQRRKGSGIYEFRKRLPTSLAGKPCPVPLKAEFGELINPDTGCFKRELTKSLDTTDHRTAKRRDLSEAARVTDLFELAARLMQGGGTTSALGSQRERSLPSPEEIETTVITGILAEDEREREEGDQRRHLQSPEERAQWPDLEDPLFGQFGMAEGHLEASGEAIEMLLTDFRQAYAKRQIGIIKAELHAYLKAADIPIDPSSLFYQRAGMVLSGHVKGYEHRKRRNAGDVVPTPSPAPATTKGPLLSVAFGQWKSGSQARGGKQPSSNTVAEAERAVRYFTQWHGDLALGNIDKPKARDFRNALSRLPTRLTAKQRGIPLRRLIESIGADHAPAHAATVNKSLNLLAAIVGAAERDGEMDTVAGFVNPFRNLTIVIDQRHETAQRMPFSEGQLGALFADDIFSGAKRPRGGGGEAAFWFPLIGLLTGARLNEIAQLRLADIRQDPESGIWFMDIGTDGGRSIKTASSRRQVPLHAELLRLGLLRYRDGLRAKKGKKDTDSLWPDIQSEDGFYSATAYTKFFGRYLRKTVGIEDKRIVFHSFRHTFKRLARDAGLTEEQHDALTGHAGNGGVGRGYGAGFGLKALHEAIGKIGAPKSVVALPEWKA